MDELQKRLRQINKILAPLDEHERLTIAYFLLFEVKPKDLPMLKYVEVVINSLAHAQETYDRMSDEE